MVAIFHRGHIRAAARKKRNKKHARDAALLASHRRTRRSTGFGPTQDWLQPLKRNRRQSVNSCLCSCMCSCLCKDGGPNVFRTRARTQTVDVPFSAVSKPMCSNFLQVQLRLSIFRYLQNLDASTPLQIQTCRKVSTIFLTKCC